MAFDGSEGSQIDLTVAARWTARYRVAGGEIHAHFFGREILQQILDQDGCMGIRVYYGLDDNGVSQLILVGANADAEDLYEGIVADYADPCPNNCDSASPLNAKG